MIDPVTTRRWAFRALFLAIAILVVFVQILPFRVGPAQIPGPDLLPLLAFAWVARRPDYIPVGLLALVMLATDIVFMRPPGLWAALTVLGFEMMRGRTGLMRDMPFIVEWILVALVVLLMTLANALMLGLVMVPQPAFGTVALRYLVTVLSYPAIVAISAFVLGVRRAAPGEYAPLGQRL